VGSGTPGSNELAPRKQLRTSNDTQPKNPIDGREQSAKDGEPLALNETKTNRSETRTQPNHSKEQRSDSIEATQFVSTLNHGPDARQAVAAAYRMMVAQIVMIDGCHQR
jgi:hypothetical protein